MLPTIALSTDPPFDQRLIERAEQLASEVGLSIIKLGDPGCDLRLVVTPDRLGLRVEQGELAGGNAVCADLSKLDTTSPAGRSLNNPLFKAVGIKKGNPHRPRVIDCTAGLGEDAWLLAATGCVVAAYERQPIIAALLGDALRRASQTQPGIAERITLHQGDASVAVTDPGIRFQLIPRREAQVDDAARDATRTDALPDAIVLDPMFPLGRKAAERKPMRVLRMLAGDDDDADDLLASALATGVHRVAVKRPLHAPPLDAGHAPSVVHKGKAVRFDVYIQ